MASFGDSFPGGFRWASFSILAFKVVFMGKMSNTKAPIRAWDLGILSSFGFRHSTFLRYPVTSVPIFSPLTTRLKLCSLKKSNTMIGIRLSMHIENAVESITFNRFTSASV